ncbi:hypothetical protein [Alkalibacillus haloalkaliphilus]|uniref:Uncharacterized protein n=1 Tax=Alkalibacillus haloalkaliphilus TaxID=94136 RepID=A0A511W503_9BACI|nr:hypothetical protein [Alkalibacillus haloalkaliphilus]GEN45418.1 hypothetical protein AHA02nite_11940 [Alkalibacillus haloalkaliphilus]
MLWITLTAVYTISFILIYNFIKRQNRNEPYSERMNPLMVVVVAALLALPILVVVGAFTFAIIGSVSLIDIMFSLNLSTSQLVILGVIFIIYLYTLDSLFELILKNFIKHVLLYTLFIFLVRVGAFYIIGSIIGLAEQTGLAIAIGVSATVLLIEILFKLREKTVEEE